VAWLELDARGHGAGGLSFDGTVAGQGALTVPLGWRVAVRFRNADGAPHSARIVADLLPVPLALGPAVFPGAESRRAAAGMFLRLTVSAHVTVPTFRT
jgi:hypothetical protein